MSKFPIEFKMTVPNFLSLLRLALLPVFAVLYLNSGNQGALLYWSFAILVLSGLTDLFDGMIARRFNQITELGKLLDPVADKLTQITVIICLSVYYNQLIPLVILCFIKEAAQAAGGALLIKRGDIVRGAKWYGKVSTFVFYGAMALIVLFPILFKENIPEWLLIVLVTLVAILMLFAFIQYIRIFVTANKATRQQPEETNEKSA